MQKIMNTHILIYHSNIISKTITPNYHSKRFVSERHSRFTARFELSKLYSKMEYSETDFTIEYQLFIFKLQALHVVVLVRGLPAHSASTNLYSPCVIRLESRPRDCTCRGPLMQGFIALIRSKWSNNRLVK